MKYKYKCTTPMLPPEAESPMMDNKQMEDWLNEMDKDGWEFVSYAQKTWASGYIQNWWIFRQPSEIEASS